MKYKYVTYGKYAQITNITYGKKTIRFHIPNNNLGSDSNLLSFLNNRCEGFVSNGGSRQDFLYVALNDGEDYKTYIYDEYLTQICQPISGHIINKNNFNSHNTDYVIFKNISDGQTNTFTIFNPVCQQTIYLKNHVSFIVFVTDRYIEKNVYRAISSIHKSVVFLDVKTINFFGTLLNTAYLDDSIHHAHLCW